MEIIPQNKELGAPQGGKRAWDLGLLCSGKGSLGAQTGQGNIW